MEEVGSCVHSEYVCTHMIHAKSVLCARAFACLHVSADMKELSMVV